MPIYTYRCESCGIQFDQQQSFNDDPLTVCPECEEKSLHKVYRPVGIVFKGSGFYSTDNRSPSGQKSRPHKDEGHDTGSASKETKSNKSGESAPKESKSEKKK